jgi:hypothetical protein
MASRTRRRDTNFDLAASVEQELAGEALEVGTFLVGEPGLVLARELGR